MSKLHVLLAAVALFALAGPEAASGQTSCSDHRISAKAIATTGDIQAFVQCAAEYVLEHGTQEARRAFNEDERWHYGPVYLFVDGIAESGEDSMTFVFPPDPSREGHLWGTSIDSFGTDYFYELHRILSVVDSGWVYYAFTNPATGLDEPKSSYVIEIDWDGNRAAIGSGLYANDIPGTCNANEVSAAHLSAGPTSRKLQEFVRCAAQMVESEGYFAKHQLEGNPRWSDGSTSVFVMDMVGNQVISSSRFRVNGNALHEWGGGGNSPAAFDGRDVLSIGDAFGEAFVYYRSFNPYSGQHQPRVSMLKRVMAHGVPVLVGAGYYVPEDPSQARPSCSDNFITARAVRTRRDIQALVHCAAEYIEVHGTEEAYRSFHEDSRWDHREHYVFVRLLEQGDERSRLLVYPPDQAREGIPGAALHEVSESLVGDYLRELHRITEVVDSGWIYYYFINRAFGVVEPKSSYAIEIDWDGQRAVVAAGLYEQDLPGTCRSELVNAASLDADPSESSLKEFVRCAASPAESQGFFARSIYRNDSRWRSGSIHVIGINPTTKVVEFGGRYPQQPFAESVGDAFGGREVTKVVETFGEAYLYYLRPDRASRMMVPSIAFLKRVVAQGMPLLVGTAYLVPAESDSP